MAAVSTILRIRHGFQTHDKTFSKNMIKQRYIQHIALKYSIIDNIYETIFHSKIQMHCGLFYLVS